MQIRKIVNYIAGGVALIHAGVTSRMMQATLMLPGIPDEFESYNQIQKFVDTLPAEYLDVVFLFFLTGTVLFILGIVTLILNRGLPKASRIRRLALRTSVLTLVGVFASVLPYINIIYPIGLSIFFIISAYYMPYESR